MGGPWGSHTCAEASLTKGGGPRKVCHAHIDRGIGVGSPKETHACAMVVVPLLVPHYNSGRMRWNVPKGERRLHVTPVVCARH